MFPVATISIFLLVRAYNIRWVCLWYWFKLYLVIFVCWSPLVATLEKRKEFLESIVLENKFTDEANSQIVYIFSYPKGVEFASSIASLSFGLVAHSCRTLKPPHNMPFLVTFAVSFSSITKGSPLLSTIRFPVSDSMVSKIVFLPKATNNILSVFPWAHSVRDSHYSYVFYKKVFPRI